MIRYNYYNNLKLEVLSLKYIKNNFETINLKKKIKMIFAVVKMHISVGTVKHFSKRYWILKEIAICTNKCHSKLVFFSGDINHLNQWYLFGNVARASRKDDSLRALLGQWGNLRLKD